MFWVLTRAYVQLTMAAPICRLRIWHCTWRFRKRLLSTDRLRNDQLPDKKLAASGKFSFMRMVRKGIVKVYEDGSDFEIGKGVTLKEGKDVTIIASRYHGGRGAEG